jgi:WD repeat-containing protein 68
MWQPPKLVTSGTGGGVTGSGGNRDLLATAGDYLRIWSINNEMNTAEMKALLNNNKHTEYCAPLTSFDWNEKDPSMLGTCSIDTTVTIWDINVSLSFFIHPTIL